MILLSTGSLHLYGTQRIFELAAEIPDEGDSPVALHHGYTFLLAPDRQLDLHGGFGLTDAAADFFVGGGFSISF